MAARARSRHVKKLLIATRRSRLALWQAEHVATLLKRPHEDLKVELLALTTRGDELIDRRLDQAGGKGLFVKELEAAMSDGRADLAVHSMKDVPAELPRGFALATALHARSVEEAFAVLCGWNRIPDEHAARIDLGTLFEPVDRGRTRALEIIERDPGLAYVALALPRSIDRQCRHATAAKMIVIWARHVLLDRVHAGHDEDARRFLVQLQLDHKVKIKDGALSTTELSQGQRKRLALLTAFLEDRALYVFDEWAADQDPYFKEIFYLQILPELKARGKTVIITSHDDRYFHMADRIVKLDYGQIDSDQYVASVPLASVSRQ